MGLIFAEFATSQKSPKIYTANKKPYYTSSLRVFEIAKIGLSESLTHLPSVIFAKISRREKFPIYDNERGRRFFFSQNRFQRDSSCIPEYFINQREKGRHLFPTRQKSKLQEDNHQEQRYKHKDSFKSSITQRLRTDFVRAVGMTSVTQLVWLTGHIFPM